MTQYTTTDSNSTKLTCGSMCLCGDGLGVCMQRFRASASLALSQSSTIANRFAPSRQSPHSVIFSLRVTLVGTDRTRFLLGRKAIRTATPTLYSMRRNERRSMPLFLSFPPSLLILDRQIARGGKGEDLTKGGGEKRVVKFWFNSLLVGNQM